MACIQKNNNDIAVMMRHIRYDFHCSAVAYQVMSHNFTADRFHHKGVNVGVFWCQMHLLNKHKKLIMYTVSTLPFPFECFLNAVGSRKSISVWS